MPGLSDFTLESFSYRTVATKTSTYTVLATDELIRCNGTFTATLPALNSLQGTTNAKKAYRFDNVSATTTTTIAAGTDSVTNVANTINGGSSYTLGPNETVIISGSSSDTDWKIVSPTPQPKMKRATWAAVATAAGVSEISVFGADGAPDNILITGIYTTATVTSAAPSTLYVYQQSASTGVLANSASLMITSMIPASTAGMVNGAIVLTNTAVAKGVQVTVMGGTTGSGHIVKIEGTTQGAY